MAEIRDGTLVIAADTHGEELVELHRLVLMERETLVRVLLEGEIGGLRSTMLLQLLVALKKSCPHIAVEPLGSRELDTPRWGHWSLL